MANTYEEWALQVIECICSDKEVPASIKVEEIKCVVHRDGHYLESYTAGDAPNEAWFSELEAIKSSQ